MARKDETVDLHKHNTAMTHQEVVTEMNKRLEGQNGIVTFCFEGCEDKAPKSVGKFVEAKLKGCNVLVEFTEENILLFTPLSMISIVGPEKDGSFPCKDICSQLFIGDKSLGKIFSEIDSD